MRRVASARCASTVRADTPIVTATSFGRIGDASRVKVSRWRDVRVANRFWSIAVASCGIRDRVRSKQNVYYCGKWEMRCDGAKDRTHLDVTATTAATLVAPRVWCLPPAISCSLAWPFRPPALPRSLPRPSMWSATIGAMLVQDRPSARYGAVIAFADAVTRRSLSQPDPPPAARIAHAGERLAGTVQRVAMRRSFP